MPALNMHMTVMTAHNQHRRNVRLVAPLCTHEALLSTLLQYVEALYLLINRDLDGDGSYWTQDTAHVLEYGEQLLAAAEFHAQLFQWHLKSNQYMSMSVRMSMRIMIENTLTR